MASPHASALAAAKAYRPAVPTLYRSSLDSDTPRERSQHDDLDSLRSSLAPLPGQPTSPLPAPVAQLHGLAKRRVTSAQDIVVHLDQSATSIAGNAQHESKDEHLPTRL
jgi:hypothetical protein